MFMAPICLLWNLSIIIWRIVATFYYKTDGISREKEGNEARNICQIGCISQCLGTFISERQVVTSWQDSRERPEVMSEKV